MTEELEHPLTGEHRRPNVTKDGLTILKVEDKHGALYWAIPTMPLPLAIICCILNIALPGIGTLISAVASFFVQPTRRNGSKSRAFCLNMISGLLQIATFIIIIGWIWSILWAMTFIQLSMARKNCQERPEIPYYVRRQSSLEVTT